jgi:hypothetical protein
MKLILTYCMGHYQISQTFQRKWWKENLSSEFDFFFCAYSVRQTLGQNIKFCQHEVDLISSKMGSKVNRNNKNVNGVTMI